MKSTSAKVRPDGGATVRWPRLNLIMHQRPSSSRVSGPTRAVGSLTKTKRPSSKTRALFDSVALCSSLSTTMSMGHLQKLVM